MAASAPRWLALLFAMIGVGALAGTWFLTEQRLTILRAWPEIVAEVVESEVTSHRDSDDNSTTYGVRVAFRFEVDGRTIEASSDRGYTTSSYNSMRRAAERFSPGSRHPIRYNPQNPADIRFNAGYTLEFFGVPVFLGVFGLIFLLVSFAVFRAKGNHPYAARTDVCPTCHAPAPPGEKFCPNCGTMLHDG